MNKYKKILEKTYCDDTKSSSEIIVEKLKYLRKNVYNMTRSEFAAGLFPSYEMSNIENYTTYSKKIYIKELTNKYEIAPEVVELNENLTKIIEDMLLCLLKDEDYNSKLINRIDDLGLESNYALIVKGLKYLLSKDEKCLDNIVKRLLISSNLFDRLQANLLVIISTGLEILKGNYILAYETITLLRKYNITNKYINIIYEYYIAKTCFYSEHNIYTLSYLNKFLLNEYSKIAHTKFIEISEYKLILLARFDVEYAIEYGNDVRLLVNYEPFNVMIDIISQKSISYNKKYNLNIFEIVTIFSFDMHNNINYEKIGVSKEVEINLLEYLKNPSDFTILRRFILPIYKSNNPYFYNILNKPNIEELRSRSRYKEILSYMEFKKPMLKQK